MIKVIFFDAGGVLHVSNNDQSSDLKFELGLNDEQLKILYSEYLPKLGKGLITETELWQSMHELFGIRLVTPEEGLFTRTFEGGLQKMPGMYDLVDDLKAAGYKVGLLTNVSPQYAEVLEVAGHYEPFDIKVLSFEVGSWKPETEIYKIALEKANVHPQEAIFVDDQAGNVEAATKLGMLGIVFEDAVQLRGEIEKIVSPSHLNKI